MRYRIGAWASAGLLVAFFWAWYLFPTGVTTIRPILAIARLTCPIAFVNFGVPAFWALLANAATYAMAGLIFEVVHFRKAPSLG